MNQRRFHAWGKRAAAWLLSLGMLCSLTAPTLAAQAPAEQETEGYALTVTPSTAAPSAGDTVTLSAAVTSDGTPVTDLASAGLQLWWWTDVWNDHTDGLNDAVYSNYDDNSGNALSADVTLPSQGSYYIVAELKQGDTSLGKAVTTFNTADTAAEEPAVGYQISVTPSTAAPSAGDTVTLTAAVTSDGTPVTDLASAGLQLWWWTDVWNDHTDGLNDAVYSNYDDNSGNALSADVTLPSQGTYYIVAELKQGDTSLGKAVTTFNTADTAAEEPAVGYQISVTPSTTAPYTGDKVTLTAAVTLDGAAVDLTAQGLDLWFWADAWGEGHSDGLTDCTVHDQTGKVLENTVTLPSLGTYYMAVQLKNGDEELAVTFVTLTTQEDTAIEDAEIDVEKIPGLDKDFIMGWDISSAPSLFASGVTFQDYAGNTLSDLTSFCKFIKDCGITHVRVRIWNDPYDTNGNGYGGGNNDVATAVEIAQACQAAGLKLLVNFHCSDFWADPGKQQAPKAWANHSLDQKKTDVYDFITDALAKIQETGAEIAMVQVGNETNNAFAGESGINYADMCALFSAGSKAVRDTVPTAQVVIHVTNPEKSTMTTWAKRLADNHVDYDVLATSYYPYWHGTFENLKSQLEAVRIQYGKQVLVAETSYAFTLNDTDGHENTVAKGSNDSSTSYPFTPQGQADFLRDLMAVVSRAGGLGVYYWEPAWITVGDTTGLEGDAYNQQVSANKALWEQHGSGWASSYASEYDPKDAGQWYGGSAVDNQAFFYANGAPVDSLHVWQYVRTGAVSNQVSVSEVTALQQSVEANGTYTLPDTVLVKYNKGNVEESVVWNQADIQAIDLSKAGTYVVHGTVTLSLEVTTGDYQGQTTAETTFTLTVKAPNLITNPDVAGVERGDLFTVEGAGVTIPSTEDVLQGTYSLHWYSPSALTASVTANDPITLQPGTYTFQCAAMGESGETITLGILDAAAKTPLFTGEGTKAAGWTTVLEECVTPCVTFTLTEATQILLSIQIDMQDGGWGSVDSLYLYQHQTPAAENSFQDISADSFFYTPVLWAVQQGITYGTSETTFTPSASCTRAQMIAFLWRYAGAPKPTATDMPFTDVHPDSFYYDAVLWATEQGITWGTSATTFGPNEPCSRAQAVTFLYRLAQRPAPGISQTPFTDVGQGSFYSDAVLWAAEQGITCGTSATTFSPDNVCSRAQAVTLLYRCAANH